MNTILKKLDYIKKSCALNGYCYLLTDNAGIHAYRIDFNQRLIKRSKFTHRPNEVKYPTNLIYDMIRYWTFYKPNHFDNTFEYLNSLNVSPFNKKDSYIVKYNRNDDVLQYRLIINIHQYSHDSSYLIVNPRVFDELVKNGIVDDRHRGMNIYDNIKQIINWREFCLFTDMYQTDWLPEDLKHGSNIKIWKISLKENYKKLLINRNFLNLSDLINLSEAI